MSATQAARVAVRGPTAVRVVFALVVMIALLPAGMALGSELARSIARWQERDIGELKGLYIWASLTGGPILSLGGLWAALALTRARPRTVRVARGFFVAALLAGTGLCAASYEAVKTAGTPVIAYELRLPATIDAADHSLIDVTVWGPKMGHGCSIDRVPRVEGRLVVSGKCVVGTSDKDPTMSLLIRPNAEGHWRMPVPAEPRIERSFGDWQTLEFLPPPRQATVALPHGNYEIRYRVSGFI